jgi:two-component system sensor histidine kinase/response regulator
LAEDNEINQQIAVELMESEGVIVELANNGREALDRLAAVGLDHYDVVFMDLQMPILDGYQAIAELRTDKRFDALPVVAMTAHAMVEERQRCLELGMQDHVTKPIDPEVLYRTIAKWSKRRGVAVTDTNVSQTADAARADAIEIPVIDGLDTVSGLKRTAGNKRLYLSILRKYVEGQAGAIHAVREALAAGDRTTAERLAHTVKGVSGNIGANTVQTACAKIENAIRTGDETPDMIANGEQALGAMIRQLQAVLGDAAPVATQQAVVDIATLKPVLRRMKGLLTDNDADALDVLSEHSDMLCGALHASAYREIEKAINGFDFAAAIVRLDAALAANDIAI